MSAHRSVRFLAIAVTVLALAACGGVSTGGPVRDAPSDPGEADTAIPDDGAPSDARPEVPVPEDPGANPDLPGPDDRPGDDGSAPGDASATDEGPADVPGDAAAGDLAGDPASGDDLPGDVPPDAVDDVAQPPLPPPDGPGPYAHDTATTTVERGNRDIPATVYMPRDVPRGPLPVVVFIPGFQLDSARYRRTLERIATHGFVVVRCDPPDPLTSVDHREMAADVSAVLDWVLGATSPAAGIADPARVALAGHSLGGKVATMTAFRDARVGALLGIDPVNGGGPTGYADSRPDIVPDEVAPLAIPVGFLGQTTNGSGSGLSPACAPFDQNFQTFYEAATSAPWAAEWDFQGADHQDFVDTEECDWLCRLACAQGEADPVAVVAGTRTLAVAFLRRHLAGETAMDAWLAGASVPAGVGVRNRP